MASENVPERAKTPVGIVFEYINTFPDLVTSAICQEPLIYEVRSTKYQFFPESDNFFVLHPVKLHINVKQLLFRVAILGGATISHEICADTIESCKSAVTNLSYFGKRHAFCPGFQESDIDLELFRKNDFCRLLELPYKHARPGSCEKYFELKKKARKKTDIIRKCDTCKARLKDFKFRLKKKLLLTPESEERRDAIFTAADSRVPMSKLTAESSKRRHANIRKRLYNSVRECETLKRRLSIKELVKH